MYKIGLSNIKGGGVGFGGRGGQGAWTEFAVVVGCILFHMHFSQSKNALLLNYGLQNLMCVLLIILNILLKCLNALNSSVQLITKSSYVFSLSC